MHAPIKNLPRACRAISHKRDMIPRVQSKNVRVGTERKAIGAVARLHIDALVRGLIGVHEKPKSIAAEAARTVRRERLDIRRARRNARPHRDRELIAQRDRIGAGVVVHAIQPE